MTDEKGEWWVCLNCLAVYEGEILDCHECGSEVTPEYDLYPL